MKTYTVDFDVTLEFSEEVIAESFEEARQNILDRVNDDGEFITAPKATNQHVEIIN